MPVKDIVDGFVESASQLYQPINYRANALAQMEVLRRATAYRNRQYVVPRNTVLVRAFNQVEQALSLQPGCYVWGLTFTIFTPEIDPGTLYVQITDACTEVPFFSDYALASCLAATAASSTNRTVRNPVLLSQPRLVAEPGKLDVEIYNSNAVDVDCQLVILVAEPAIAPQEMMRYLERQRIQELL